MDNNYAEQAIRTFTISKKNFVLMESDHGAKASAMIFSIAETATANNLNTYECFEHLLSEIPKHQNDKDLKFLDDFLHWSKAAPKKVLADSKSLKFSKFIYLCQIPAEMRGF